MIRMLAKLSALLGLVLLGTAAASAQIGDSSLPIDIRAEHAFAVDDEKRLVWVGSVHAIQGDSSLRADRLEVFYSGEGGGEGWGDIERIVAIENVFYETPSQRARGDRGVYLMANETITLTGDVVITQGENTITTDQFVSNLATGDSQFGEQGSGNRVRMVLQPQSTNAAEDDASGGDDSR